MSVIRNVKMVAVCAMVLSVLGAAGEASALSDSFDAAVPTTNGQVLCVLQAGSLVYVGGNFSTIGGQARNCLAAFNSTTGVVDATFLPGLNVGGQVWSLAIDGSTLYAGGLFSSALDGSVARNRLAAFNATTGVPDALWDPDVSLHVLSIAVSSSKVFACGYFTQVNGSTARTYLAAFNKANNSDTGTVDAWNPVLDDYCRSLLVVGSYLYVGGSFTTTDNTTTTRNRLAAYALPGLTLDTSWDPDLSGGSVFAMQARNQKLYVAGGFSTVNGSTTRNCLAALELAGSTRTGVADASWDPDVDADIYGLAVTDTLVCVGGTFANVNSPQVARANLAAFPLADDSSDGTQDGWDPTGNNTVRCVALSGTSGVFAGGDFTTIGGTSRGYVAGFGSTVPVELSGFSIE